VEARHPHRQRSRRLGDGAFIPITVEKTTGTVRPKGVAADV
jgi:hypothetical protein